MALERRTLHQAIELFDVLRRELGSAVQLLYIGFEKGLHVQRAGFCGALQGGVLDSLADQVAHEQHRQPEYQRGRNDELAGAAPALDPGPYKAAPAPVFP
ncbi:hypothetical protein D3C78_948120 [compost metagenome]